MTDAYAAGLIDGEGCLSLSLDKRKACYSPRIDVGMAKRAKLMLESLATEYGGTVRRFREATARWEESFAWTVTARKASLVAERIYPHLRVKTEQARLIVSFQRMVDALSKQPNGKPKWNMETRSKADAIRILIQELNRKGPQTDQQPGWFARVVGDYCLTPQADLFSDLGFTEYSETFPDSGTWDSGYLYELQSLVPAISENACSSWPTPRAHEAGEDFAKATRSKTGMDLKALVSNWKTPATDSFRGRGGDRKEEMGLDQQARYFPTPAYRDYRTPNNQSYQERSGTKKGEQLQNFVAHSLPAQTTPDGQTSFMNALTSRRRLVAALGRVLLSF